MLCLACGLQMRLVRVEPHDTIDLPGFEHHSFQCGACGDVERRVAFSRDRHHKVVDISYETQTEIPSLNPHDNSKHSFLQRTVEKLRRGNK